MNGNFTKPQFADDTNLELASFLERFENVKFGTRNVIFGCFREMFRFKDLNCKTIVIFQISPSN